MFSIERFLVCLTFLIELACSGFAQTRLTPEQWREELRYFAANMQKDSPQSVSHANCSGSAFRVLSSVRV